MTGTNGGDRIRVAFYSDASGYGGAEIALATLIAALPDRVEPILLATDPEILGRMRLASPAATARRLPRVPDKRHQLAAATHLRAVRQLRPDILHANLRNAWSCQYALTAAFITPEVASVATLHSLLPPSNRRQLHLNRIKLKRLDALVAVSEAAAERVDRIAGLDAGHTMVIPSGIPSESLAARARPKAGPIVGSAGRLSPEKRYDLLLHALTRLPEVTVVLVGDGPERQSLERLARALGVSDRLIITGWDEEPRAWLPVLDVFVLCSDREAGSIALGEAMLASRPIVATEVGATPELVLDGTTGILVPPGDAPRLATAITTLLADSSLRDRLGSSARELAARRFDVGAMSAAYMRIYEGIRRRSRRSRIWPRAVRAG